MDHVKAASVLKSKYERCGLNNEAAWREVHQPGNKLTKHFLLWYGKNGLTAPDSDSVADFTF